MWGDSVFDAQSIALPLKLLPARGAQRPCQRRDAPWYPSGMDAARPVYPRGCARCPTCGQPWLATGAMLKAAAGGSGNVMVVGLTPRQEMGCFSMRCLRSDGKGGESARVGSHPPLATQALWEGAIAPGMFRLSPSPTCPPVPAPSPAVPRGRHSLVLLNIGHNSGHGDEGPGGVGQGGRQPLQ